MGSDFFTSKPFKQHSPLPRQTLTNTTKTLSMHWQLALQAGSERGAQGTDNQTPQESRGEWGGDIPLPIKP